MGFDISISSRKTICCPHCGEVVCHQTVDSVMSGGSCWRNYLESIGYYVPAEARTEDNDWYGESMVLSFEQTEGLVRFLTKAKPYEWQEAIQLVKEALEDGNCVEVNADW